MHTYNSFDRRVGPHEQNMVDKHVFLDHKNLNIPHSSAVFTRNTLLLLPKNSRVCLPGATVVILRRLGITIYFGGGCRARFPTSCTVVDYSRLSRPASEYGRLTSWRSRQHLYTTRDCLKGGLRMSLRG